MYFNYDENRISEVMAAMAKVKLSDYRKYFPEVIFDPSEQLMYIQEMLEKLRKEESAEEDELRSIEEAMKKHKNDEETIFYLKQEENHIGWIYMNHDALRANLQIAMLAPAIEGLYKKSLYVLVNEKFDEKISKEFFDSNRSFSRSSKRYPDGGAVNRIMQAFKRLNIESNFPSDTKEILLTLFGYRNALFHNGLEWSKEDCEKFLDEKQPSVWFTSHADLHRSYFILPTREFIDKLVNFFSDSMNSFVKSKQGLIESVK